MTALVGVEADPLGPEGVAAGPWCIADPAGGVRIGFLLVPPVTAERLRALPVRSGGTPLRCAVDLATLDRGQERQSALVTAVWHVPAGITDLVIGSRIIPIPRPPLNPLQPVRLAVAGARNYPSRQDLDRLAPGLGGPVQAVLLIGAGLERKIGTSDWESQVPLLITAPAATPALRALVGTPDLAWSQGLSWGPLGITILDPHEPPALTLGRMERPWKILCDTVDLWDLGLLAPRERREVLALRTILAQTSRSGVPLILAGGSPSGFLSEPLDTNAKGHLAPRAGGSRYVQVAATGDGCVGLPREIALPLDEPSLVGLVVTPRFFTLVLQPLTREDRALKYTWTDAAEDGVAKAGPGWGFGAGAALLEQWRAGRATETRDELQQESLCLEALQIPRAELAKGDWTLAELFQLAEKDGERVPGPAARALARRLVADVEFLGEEWGLLARLPPGLRRDALLRWFAHAGTEELRWRPLAARSQDPMIIRAVLSQVERQPDSPLLTLLVDRLTAQAANRIPLDEEPMIQARITAAVFGSAILSPTALRGVARDLLTRVAPLARPPIERFLAAHGRFREPPQEP